MAALGIEVYDGGVVAVAVDEHGGVSSRGGGTGADLAAATLAALDGLSASSPLPPAVAAARPQSPASDAAMGALRGRFGRSFRQPRPFAAGTAAAAAEAWAGAARGKKDVVFFAVAEHASAGILRGGAPIVDATRPTGVAWLSLNPVEREDYRKIGCL
jgi:predicted NBD/HSP70 family sugar kinase